MSKRIANGIDLSYRRSNQKAQHNKWTAHLAQGETLRQKEAEAQQKLEREQKAKAELKLQLKREARALDLQLGFIDAAAEEARLKLMPEWKKQKMFLKKVFPPPVVSKKYKNKLVFKNKQSMTEYHRGLVSEEEWEVNLQLLSEMRQEMEDEENQGKESTEQTTQVTDVQDCQEKTLSTSEEESEATEGGNTHQSIQPESQFEQPDETSIEEASVDAITSSVRSIDINSEDQVGETNENVSVNSVSDVKSVRFVEE